MSSAGDPFDPRSELLPHISGDGGITDEEILTDEELAALGADADTGLLPPAHDDNLALHMNDVDLNNLGDEVAEMFDADLKSREKHWRRFKRGLEILGVTNSDLEAALFEGASTVIHPMVMEAVIQYQARAVEELFPATGPVKATVLGEETKEMRDRADRVEDHMNYQLTTEDDVYFIETGQLQMYLALYGSAYRKGFHDPKTDTNVLRFIRAEDLILPYRASSMLSSPRISHKFELTENDFKIYKRARVFRDVEIEEPGEEETPEDKQALDDVDDKEEIEADDDITYTFVEQELYYDLPGFPDPNEIALPYIVTIELSSRKVVSIYRAWKEDDKLCRRPARYSEWSFIPGFGVYSLGLIHIIGSLADAATDSLRALLDSATFANMQGGFKSKDASVKGGEIELEPGVWKDVDMSSEELPKAFYTPPFKEPSMALFHLLGLLTDLGRRVAGTTDMNVGDADNKAPVGTTLALIEQGQKVYSGVHRRGHKSAQIEFQILYDLNRRYVSAEGYPYKVPGADKKVFQADYDPNTVHIIPVSDPNIASQTQRIAQAQAQLDLADRYPEFHRRFEVVQRMYRALKIPDHDAVLIDPENLPVMDPVSENIAMVNQRPVRAKDGEDHAAHLAVHMAFFQHPQFGGNPDTQQLFAPAMIAHLAEHVSLLYAALQRSLGVQVPPINLAPGAGPSIVPPMPPQQAMMIGQQAQQVIAQFMQQAGFSTPPQQAAADAAPKDTPADERVKDSAAFRNIGAGVKDLAAAGVSMQQGEQALAGLPAALDGPQPPQGQPPQNGGGQ